MVGLAMNTQRCGMDPLPAGPARDAAVAAARACGVEIRELADLPDLITVYDHIDGVWGPNLAQPPVSPEMLRALATSGNYVVGAFARDDLVGSCVGFFGPPRTGTLHSHIAAVSPRARGRAVGFALKVHQRAWALAHGVSTITWTFDPLIARNAYFNVTKLASTPQAYLPDFYGEMDDSINRNDPTDRLLIGWKLESAQVEAACRGIRTGVDATELRTAGASVVLDRGADGWPRLAATSGQTVLVAVPEDVERLRSSDPELASAWRHALRDVLLAQLSDGARVTGFDRAGWYVLTREAP
jgi:predicted GNAT superfamily acetyltransferase